MRTPTPPNPHEIPLIDRLRAKTAGRYVVHAELGVGGMATVFKATEVALEREVAIKVMNAEMATTPGAFDRFRREARVAAALSHPHIVPIYAIGEDPALAWFAMKYIEGRGLDSILRQEGAQPVDRVIDTIATVGKALHVAHEKGVVHRDVKPANIMVGSDGWLYVTDFGIAKRDDAQGLTQAGTVVGTPAYMSPEQFNGQEVTGAADQYALGIVAYEMLAGRTPFDAKSLGEVMRGHLLDAPPPLRARRVDVPVGLADIVNRMLEKDPAKRFPTLAVAVAALEGLQGRSGARRSAPITGSIPAPPPPRVSASTPTSSPTTPIPRSNPSLVTSGTRR
ncbi:MAG: serine/threonine protein kinase, partial [Gemmatimonadaceae bacterium]|nr:serine/threonine protein kinase [Gemmatimonadaceae bacterium]